MKFFSKEEVGSVPLAWEAHSTTTHSASTIVYLGLNEAGWIKLQLNPRFVSKEGLMAKAIQSVSIDMANPDEDSDIQPKSSRVTNAKDSSNTIVEVEDLVLFLNHLIHCRCITEQDAKSISDTLNNMQPQSYKPLSTTKHDENVDNRSQLDIVF